MIKAKEQFLTLSQILGAIRRRIVSVIFMTGVISIVGLVCLFMLRDTFTSEGGFYVNVGRGTVTIDPTATTSQTAQLMDTRQSEVQSIKDMLGSRMMIERTARRVGIDRILEQRSWLDLQKESLIEFIEATLGIEDKVEAGLTAEQTADLKRLQGAVEYIADRLRIDGDKEGNTIQIKGKAHTSLLAHDIVEALMIEFQQQYVKVHSTTGSQDFFDKEYDTTVERVRLAEEELAAYKNKMNAISIESKRELLHKESEVLQEDLIKTESELVSKRAEVEELNKLIEAEPEMVSNQATARSSAAADTMRADLYKLEVAEKELASKYSDSHPMLIKTRQALADARATYEKQDARFDEKAEGINPIRQELTITKLKALGMLEALQAKQKSLTESIANNSEKIQQLNSDEIRVAELTRSADTFREELKNYSHKREESRRQAELDAALISALQVSQEATHVIKKSGPRRLLGLAIIGFVAVVFSCSWAVYRESNNSLHDDDTLFHHHAPITPDLFQRGGTTSRNPNDAYTILSGRIPNGATSPSAEMNGSKQRGSVHVTENIRG